LASGGITFKRPGEEESDDEDEEEEGPNITNGSHQDVGSAGDQTSQHPNGVKVIETGTIIIRDED